MLAAFVGGLSIGLLVAGAGWALQENRFQRVNARCIGCCRAMHSAQGVAIDLAKQYEPKRIPGLIAGFSKDVEDAWMGKGAQR